MPLADILLTLMLDFAQIVLTLNLQMTNMIMIDTYYYPESESLGKSLPLAYTLVSLVLDRAQMVLVVRKHLQMANMLRSGLTFFLFLQLSQKIYRWGRSCPWLHLDVPGARLGPDGPGCLETPSSDK